MILAMVENDAAEGVINTVVDVIAAFAVANGFADDACDRSGGGGYEKATRLCENLDLLRE